MIVFLEEVGFNLKLIGFDHGGLVKKGFPKGSRSPKGLGLREEFSIEKVLALFLDCWFSESRR